MKEKIKEIDLTKIFDRDPFAKFLKDQNIISWLLFWIIKNNATFSDKRFVEWLERKPLGELIQIFKGVTKSYKGKVFKINRPQGYKIGELIQFLEEYNIERRKMVHELLKIKFETTEEILNLVKKNNQKGKIIIAMLSMLFKKEINKKLQELKKNLNSIENLSKK